MGENVLYENKICLSMPRMMVRESPSSSRELHPLDY